MPLLALKVLMSGALVGSATFVQRRFGNRASGFLVGLPITTAPYLLLVAIEHGSQFTAQSAEGVLKGQISLVIFIAAYVNAPGAWKWWQTLGSATMLCLFVTLILTSRPIPSLVTFAALAVVWLLAVKLWPPTEYETVMPERTWLEMPVRIIATLAILVGLTWLAPKLGAALSGGLATLPVISIVLCGTAHRMFGPLGPRQFLRGLLISLPGSTAFSLTVSLLAPKMDKYLALGIALGLTFAVATWQFRYLRFGRT